MRSYPFPLWVCAFLALAASVTIAQDLPVYTLAELYSYWMSRYDEWGDDYCIPRDIYELVDCVHGDGFSESYSVKGTQDLSGTYTVSNGFAWVCGYPLTVDNALVAPMPSFSDFWLYHPVEASRLQMLLPTANFNSLSWSTNTAPPFLFLRSQYVSNMNSRVSFRWQSCPIITQVYMGFNYVPRWWADANISGYITLEDYMDIFPDSDYPPLPWINLPYASLEACFSNSIHFIYREGWE